MLKEGQAVIAFSNKTGVSCLNVDSHPAAICSVICGAWRRATLKNARQKAMEAQTQGIRISAIVLNIASSRSIAH
jgi:hypothetical protein